MQSMVQSNRSTLLRILHVCACALLLATSSAGAATPLVAAGTGGKSNKGQQIALPEHLSREEVRALLSRLSDEQVRELLMRELDRNAAPQSEGEVAYMDRVRAGMHRLRASFSAAFASWHELPGVPSVVWDRVTAGGTHSSLGIVLGLILGLLAGLAVEAVVRRLLRGAAAAAQQTAPASKGTRLAVAGMWLLRELLLVALFMVVAMGAFWIALGERESAEPLYAVVLAIVGILRAIAVLVDAVIARGNPSRRLVPLSDAGAHSLARAVMVPATLVVLNQGTGSLATSYGVSPGAESMIALLLSSLVLVVICVFLWRARAHFEAIILGEVEHAAPADAAFRRLLAASWPGLSIAYVIGVWVTAVVVRFATQVSVLFPALASLVLVLVLPLADAGLRRLVANAFAPKKTTGIVELSVGADGEVSRETRAPTQGADYRHLILRYLRVLMFILLAAAFLALWHIQLGALMESLVGTRVAGALFDIGVTVLLAYAVWGIVKAAVEYHIGPEHEAGAGAHGESEAGGPGGSRLQTLLPLFRKFILVTLMVIGVLISLSALGVNIGPLVAGAGIVGIAIGFGAQTLVRDIVSGVFFLIDDAFRMGEYVEIDNIRGSVEAISVRSLRLRHHNGPLHTIPFGEIKHLTNYSRDWAIMKFELRVPFETDLDKVRKIIKSIGKEMTEDEELGPLMLSPLKSQGVNRMDDSALIIRCKFTALPGQQFFVRREAFNRIQKAFEENGIHFAPRRVIVEATTPALAAAGAGALDAQGDKEKQSKPDDRG